MGTTKKGKAVKRSDSSKDGRRKAAGIAAIIAGAPNLLASAALFVLGVIGFLFLVYFLLALIFKDTGGDDWAVLFIVILIVLVVAALIALFIILILLLLLLIGMSGQVIGGILAFKGKRFTTSVALLVIGTVISTLSGFSMFAGAAIAGTDQIGPLVFFILWGVYDIISAIVTAVCTIVLIGCKDSFVANTSGSKKGRSNTKRGRVK